MTPNSSRSTTSAGPTGCSRPATALPTPDPQWARTSYANLVVNPVDSDDDLVSSSTGNIFETTNQGETWFDIGTPATFGSPGGHELRPGFRRTRPQCPFRGRQPR